MSSRKNKSGLLGDIPADVERLVRQRDGFGCVICGSFFYQYDHIGVEFKDALTHCPDDIVLLCGGCHDRKTRGALSTKSIRSFAVNPKCKQDNFSWGPLDIGDEHPVVQMGDITAYRSKTLLRIYGENLFALSKPVGPGLPFTLNAKIFDRQGNLIVRVVENQIIILNTSWDVEVIGQRISIRSGKGVFEVVLRVEPPSKIVIERLQMFYRGVSVACKEGHKTEFLFNNKIVQASGGVFEDSEVVVDFDDQGLVLGRGGSVYMKTLGFYSGG
ncbi:HNH endonuclease signature motif containing protein [Pseudomonas sp.]|uniref:HNH endonuclease n=1 Tax=Pseudomonas sp. TaxID=306 RepID=UPI0028ADAB80|nr:HNH endonuclease signature motif containing protein [Pseudomonas sp.]